MSSYIHGAVEKIKTDSMKTGHDPGKRFEIAGWFAPGGHLHDHAAGILGLTGDVKTDSESLYVAARDLEYMFARAHEAEYPDLPAADGRICFIDTSIPAGAETWTQRYLNGTSVARIAANGSGGTLPTVTLTGAEVTRRFVDFENAYAWTFRDQRRAAMAGQPLEPPLRKLALRAHEHAFHRTCLWGRDDLDVWGMLTHPNVPRVLAAATGTGNSRDFRDKDIDDILADFATLIDSCAQLTNYQRFTTTVIMSIRLYNYLSRTRIGAGDGTLSMLDMVKNAWKGGDQNVNGGQGVTFMTLRELDYTIAAAEAAADDGTGTTVNVDIDSTTGDCMIAYVNDREIISFLRPMRPLQHPVQVRDLTMLVPVESKGGGCKLDEPLTMARMERCWLPD